MADLPESIPITVTMAISKLAEALAKAQMEIKAPLKNRKVDFIDKNNRRVHYNYADLADVIDCIREPLGKNGLSYAHQLGYKSEMFGLETLLMHSSGEYINSWYPLPDPAKQQIRAQEFGSALTYARRYSLSSLIGIASEEDDDGGGAAPTDPPKGKAKGEQKPKDPPKDEKPKQNPNEFIMPFGEGVKGRKLADIPTTSLGKIAAHCKAEIEKEPKIANLKQMSFVYAMVKAVLTSRKPEDDIPENLLDKKTGEVKDDEGDYVIDHELNPDKLPMKKLPEKTLKAIVAAADKYMKSVPPPQDLSETFAINAKIKAFLASMGA